MVREKWTSEQFGSGVAGRPLLLPGQVRPRLERTPATTLGNEFFSFSRNDSKLGTGSLGGNPAGMVGEKWTSEQFGSGVAERPLLLPGQVRPRLERTPATTLGNEFFFFFSHSARDPQVAILQEWLRTLASRR